MAIISKEKLYIKNHGQVTKVVKYTKGVFNIELPEIVCSELNLIGKDKIIVAKSEDDVNKMFDLKIKEWESAKTIIQKVILFKAKFQGALATESYRNSAYDGKYHPHGGSGNYTGSYEFMACDLSITSDSLGLSIDWGVFNKKTVNGKSDYVFVSGRKIDVYHSFIRQYTEIPHSDAREKFFMELDESFAKMIAKVHKGLGDLTPDKLLSLTDKGLSLIN